MLDIIKSYISNEEFYIIVLKDSIYIKNYSKLLGITFEEIMIEICGSLYRINGNDFVLLKSIGNELLIKGHIERITKL